ncbi:hypothetical protein J4460_05630 [Candidatus Woesearchaeota archaeon]|nr:MAG: hypothetical protein QS99_C0015G0043 [archaeon GW2011_AR4]MBS3130127.1 hypothetical protein [Candidatus Woesearchaeota archaeon]HIH38744.1 hypothetical protein [Candidatus Woesearchaeota archaeon]HIH48087.1 hypothetical protein [Candidatus Woesearchaeota archaeon]HIJ04273.1 hypothetical protein [Candidatus Woesearchaeota archaeon]
MENEDEINTWYEETKDKAMKEYLKKLSLIRNQEVKIDDEEEGKQKKKKPQVKLSEKDQLIQERKLEEEFNREIEKIHAGYHSHNQAFDRKNRHKAIRSHIKKFILTPFRILFFPFIVTYRYLAPRISTILENIKNFLKTDFSLFIQKHYEHLSFSFYTRSYGLRKFFIQHIRPIVLFFYRPVERLALNSWDGILAAIQRLIAFAKKTFEKSKVLVKKAKDKYKKTSESIKGVIGKIKAVTIDPLTKGIDEVKKKMKEKKEKKASEKEGNKEEKKE